MSKLAKETDLSEGVHVIKFYADWCGPCRLYAPVFKRARSRHTDLNFYEVNVDESPEIRDQYGVQSIPATVIVKDGEVERFIGGATSSNRLDEILTSMV